MLYDYSRYFCLCIVLFFCDLFIYYGLQSSELINVRFYPCLIAEAVKNIIQYMGMQPCERSDKVIEGKSSHTLFLAGVYRGGHDCLVRAKLALTDAGVTMQLTVRSTDPDVSEVLASAV